MGQVTGIPVSAKDLAGLQNNSATLERRGALQDNSAIGRRPGARNFFPASKMKEKILGRP